MIMLLLNTLPEPQIITSKFAEAEEKMYFEYEET